ncbi:MAG: YggS family pyridoxal phosphate-dependent enzyme [Spirochaetales bacterium]|nr:YggS family pyridoxal phosphate-dependent enzyme [Spirochaetales bacterium]
MDNERVTEIKNNIDNINNKLNDAAIKCGRSFKEIKLMAVSKTKPVEDIKAAYDAGQRLFGENRIVEASEKFKQLPDDANMHMIGNLQSNKAKLAAESASCVQSIHKLKTAKEINKRAKSLGKKIDFLIEINTSGEESKEGYSSFDDLMRELEDYFELDSVNFRGLMTVGPLTDDTKAIHKSFADLYNYYQKLKTEYKDNEIDILSMGMSSDYEIAIEEGSTMIRVGTAIFGSRNY